MTRLQIHPLSLLTFLFAFLTGYIYEVLLLFSIVLMHELGHVFCAKAYNWRVAKISILPIGGVAVVEEHGNKPLREELLVVLAGPLMNIIMILLAWLFHALGFWSLIFTQLFIDYNLIILLFNLLPIYPLDGGRLLQALLSLCLPYKRAIHCSLFGSTLFFLLYLCAVSVWFASYLLFWMIAVFLLFSILISMRQASYQFIRFLLDRQLRSPSRSQQLPVASIVLLRHQTVKEALEKMFRQRYHYFCLVDARGQLLHVFNEKEMLHAFFHQRQGFRTLEDMLK